MRKLDYGCGCGLPLELTPDRKRYHNWLVENADSDVIGIDINHENCRRIQKLVSPKTWVMCVDGHQTPFPDSHFDHVHVGGVLHHMADYRKALAEVARITRNGGTLFISETVENDPVFKIGRALVGNWRGDMVMSRFTAEQLEAEVARYYKVLAVRHYWRFYISDLLLYFNAEPRVSLAFNRVVNGLMPQRLRQAVCSHVVIEAIRISMPKEAAKSSG